MGSPLSGCAASPQGDGILAAGRPWLDAPGVERARLVRTAACIDCAVF